MFGFGRVAMAMAALLLASAATAAEAPTFRAQGNEPSWSLTKTADGEIAHAA